MDHRESKIEYGYENQEEQEKNEEEEGTSCCETRWLLAPPTGARSARILDRWSGWCGKGGQQQQSRATTIGRVATSQSRDGRWRAVSRDVQTRTWHDARGKNKKKLRGRRR